MKIEEIRNEEEHKNIIKKNYWFPFPKGFNRILIIIACLIIIYTVYEYPEKVNTFFFTLFIESVVYVAAVWVYRGFKE
jgi:hypothetical protein